MLILHMINGGYTRRVAGRATRTAPPLTVVWADVRGQGAEEAADAHTVRYLTPRPRRHGAVIALRAGTRTGAARSPRHKATGPAAAQAMKDLVIRKWRRSDGGRHTANTGRRHPPPPQHPPDAFAQATLASDHSER